MDPNTRMFNVYVVLCCILFTAVYPVPSDQCLDTTQEFRLRERLHQIIITACHKTYKFIRLLSLGRQEKHWNERNLFVNIHFTIEVP